MNVVVIGAGKMGLPLACQFAARGARVVACDKDVNVVKAINAGISLIGEPGVGPLLEQLSKDGRVTATTDIAVAVADADVVVVIVPVLLTSDAHADLRTIEHVSREVGKGLKRGAMVCYETTLPVGQTRKLGQLISASGRIAGEDFDLVFSPERIKSETIMATLSVTPKVVGGITPKAAERGAEFYQTYLGAPVINVGTLEASEFVKLAGMLYRDVNIALSNELARYSEAKGIDIRPVIRAANTDNESALLQPGIGVGGHCTPVYPYFAIHDAIQAGSPLELAAISRRVNDGQPGHQLNRLAAHWRPLNGERVTILGLAFRPQVKEHTLSPAFLLQRELTARGAVVMLHDPLYSADEIRAMGFQPTDLDASLPGAWVLNTSHRAYESLDFGRFARLGLQAVIDGRGLWSQDAVTAAGITYLGVGIATRNDAVPARAGS